MHDGGHTGAGLASGRPRGPDSGVRGRRRPDRVQLELTNRGGEDALVGFYLRVSPASLAQLVCSAGEARRGRFHGSANLVIPAGQAVSVSATLQPQTVGDQDVRVVAVTRNETIERADTVVVAAPPPLPAPRLPGEGRLASLVRGIIGAMADRAQGEPNARRQERPLRCQ